MFLKDLGLPWTSLRATGFLFGLIKAVLGRIMSAFSCKNTKKNLCKLFGN